MLIDRYLRRFDTTEVQETRVAAPPAITYAAILDADIRDPVVDALFAIRELPDRLARRLRHEAPRLAPAHMTFRDLASPAMGFVPLAEEEGVEFVVGAIGRFWKRDYGWYPFRAEEFTSFNAPGYARIAIGFLVTPAGSGSILRYEARTAATDDAARRRFRRYWRLIHPGVALVMRRALRKIRREAERRRDPAWEAA